MDFKTLTSAFALSLLMTSSVALGMEGEENKSIIHQTPIEQSATIKQEENPIVSPHASAGEPIEVKEEQGGWWNWLTRSKPQRPKVEEPKDNIIVIPPPPSDESEGKDEQVPQAIVGAPEDTQSTEAPKTAAPPASKSWFSLFKWWESQSALDSGSFINVEGKTLDEQNVKNALSQSTQFDLKELKKAMEENDPKKFQEKIAAISAKGPKGETGQ